MHYSSWLSLAFSASVIARPEGVVDSVGKLTVRDVQDVAALPAIKGTFEVLTKDGDELDKAIAALTKENAASQIDVIASKLTKLSTDTSAQAAKIGKSGPLGILELSGLLSQKTQDVWTGLAKEAIRVVNQTSIDIMAKRDITKTLEPAKLDSLSKAIKSQKKGIMDIVAIIPGQIPTAVKTQISNMAAKAASSAAAAQATAGADGAAAPKMPKIPDINDPKIQEALGKGIDDFLDQVVNIVSGKQESFIMPALPAGVTLPPGINLPGTPAAASPASGGMGDMAGMPGMAAPPAAEAPKATTAPKVPTTPKTPAKSVPKMPAKGSPAKNPKGPSVESDEWLI
jgi:hypothetical protein